ncbi:MAG: DMT family transporter [Actinobacteria bacterium]|nr:DMT family transporter [Actinomycetota bacterium]NCX00579.1 DMT family transporter [Actinomycetota bacterium]
MRDRDHSKLPTGRDIGLLTLVIIGIGTSGPVIALSTMPILALIFWRNLGGFFLVLPWAFRELDLSKPEVRVGIRFAFLSGIALALHFIGFFIAMRYTSVAVGTALTALQPIFAAYFVKRLGGTIPQRAWTGMSIAFIGVVIITGVDLTISRRAFLGDLAAIACAALAAMYVVLGARARETVSTATYTSIAYLTCALISLSFALAVNTELFDFDTREWLLLIALIAGAQILGHTILNFTLKSLSPAIASLVVFFEVPVSAILAFWWLNQLPPLGTVPGLILILVGCRVFLR